MRRRPLATLSLLVVLGVTACTSDSGQARVTRRGPPPQLGATGSQPSVPTTSQAPAPVTASPALSTTPTTLPVRCARAGVPPAGSTSRVMGDIDGDRRGDLFYLPRTTTATRIYGVMTSSGVRSELAVDSASPIIGGILGVIDANLDGHRQLLISDGRSDFLVVFQGCDLEIVHDANGHDVLFTAFGNTGVGCVDVNGDGRRDLVRLQIESRVGAITTWSRTILRLRGAVATDGPTDHGTFVSPQDDAKIDLLTSASCGKDTFQNALSQPTG